MTLYWDCVLSDSLAVMQVTNPPFNISNGNAGLPLGQNTAAMSVSHHDGTLQYNTHNLYGLQVRTPMSHQGTQSDVSATLSAVEDLPVILSSLCRK